MDRCFSCHGFDGRGKTSIGRNLYPKPPDLQLPERHIVFYRRIDVSDALFCLANPEAQNNFGYGVLAQDLS